VRTKAIEAKLMLTRRIILDTTAYFIAVCLAANRLATAGSAAADDASALAFISAIYNSYTPDGADPVRIDTGRKLRRYFEPALAEAMNKDQENAANITTRASSARIPSLTRRIGISNTSTSPSKTPHPAKRPQR
jgi:hypothetical protein